MAAPSTKWRERVGADEEMRHSLYAHEFAELQARKSARFGKGRALHRKQILGLEGHFEVLAGLPEPACHGLFAKPAEYDALVRLSNGGTDRQDDRKPDVRGFAIKVRGLSGTGALGSGPTNCQDFLLINHSAFAFAGADEFVGLVRNTVKGPRAVLRYLVGRYGLLGAMGKIRRFSRTFGKPFSGFASEPFHSAAPIACGPYAVRVRLLPAVAKTRRRAGDWASEFLAHLNAGPLKFELQLQFFVDESSTPIEDASKDWPEDVAPYVTVGVLTLPPQDPESAKGKATAAAAENTAFDPWRALMAHRPLGEVMRARRVVYYESQKGRR